MAALLRDKSVADKPAAVRALAEKYDQSTDLVLAEAQAQLEAGHRDAASKLLENNAQLASSPAILGYLIASARQHAPESVSGLLERAVKLWSARQEQGDAAEQVLVALLRALSAKHAQQHEDEAAVDCLRRAVQIDDENAGLLAEFVLALAKTDVEAAEQYAEKLPSADVAGDDEQLDVDALEEAAYLRVSKFRARREAPEARGPQASQADVEAANATTSAVRTKHKRKRRGPLPQNYDPNRQPDPERWLKKYERSSYAGRRRRRVKDNLAKGSQGAASISQAEAERLDASLRAPPPTEPVQNKKVAAAKKKGKKGGKRR